MPLKKFDTMDNNILFSIVNMQLRDKFESLDDLARYYDIDKQKLCAQLAQNQFFYDELTHQFKSLR